MNNDLREMNSALNFAAQLLRSELGPGGIFEQESSDVRATWASAADYLTTTGDFPMIPLHMWRTRDIEETQVSGDAVS